MVRPYDTYKENLIVDVEELINDHVNKRTGSRGKQNLGYLTRSAWIMLCGAYEHFLELLAEDVLNNVLERISADKLHRGTKKALVEFIESRKDESFCLRLSGDGWKDVLRDLFNLKRDAFHTPSIKNTIELFSIVGIDISGAFDDAQIHERLNDFIKTRGEIAHKGRKARYPHIKEIEDYKDFFDSLVVQIHNHVVDKYKQTYACSMRRDHI